MVVIKIDGGIYMKDRVEVLKSYLQRLGKGESLESVRADFVKEFAEVDATEIMKAEQQMMKEGTPITEVQKLCDVHAALFHGMTQEEKKQNAPETEAAAEKYRKSRKDEEISSIKRTSTVDTYTGKCQIVRTYKGSEKRHRRKGKSGRC